MFELPSLQIALTVCLIVSFIFTALVVLTGSWHHNVTADSNDGIQKVHLGNTPRIGGMGIYLAIWVAAFLLEGEPRSLLKLVLIAAFPALLFGLIEDVTGRVGIKLRLLATMASGLLAWWLTGYALWQLDIPGIDLLLAYTPIAVIFTVFAVGGIANALNLIDGFNGLASGTLMICLAGLGALAATQGDWELTRMALIIGVATLGFFLMNFPMGKIFLGDGGAYMLGFMLAWMAVMVSMRHIDTISPAAALLICGYPVVETLFSIVRRARRGLSIDQPDRMHLHSLVYRRLVPKLFCKGVADKGANRRTEALCNAATAPALWVFSAIPAVAGVLLHDNTIACWIAFGLLVLAYDTLYRRLTRFKWSILGVF